MVSEVTYLRLPRPPLFGGMPEDVSRELDFAFHRAFPHSIDLGGKGPLWLRYGVTERGTFDTDGDLSYREVVAWLCIGPRRVGMVRVREWHVLPWVDDRTFFWAADWHSNETYDLARATLSAWPIQRLIAHGSLLEVCRVWMAPGHAHDSLWATAINSLIRRRYARGYSAMFLNVWPADHKADSIDVDGWQGRKRWNRRRTALARLAQRTLGVQPLPRGCPSDDAWWQWRRLAPGVPAPRKRRLTWL